MRVYLYLRFKVLSVCQKGTIVATGISKREQHSTDAISARDFHGNPIPLPGAGATVTLSYARKACLEDITRSLAHSFIQIGKSKQLSLQEIPDNTFVLGDNFFVLNRLLHDEKKVTLFYLDPPFGTGLNFESRNLEHAYGDSMVDATYLEFMRQRLILMWECLTDDGSIYLHIGHKMLAHLKILMDEIFGAKNFRNLVTRRKCSSKNFTRNQFANLNDYILFYSKSKRYKWNQPGLAPDKKWIQKEYPKIDKFGRRYKLVPVHAPGTRRGETGQPWQGKLPPPGKHWQYAPTKLDELDQQGDIHWSRNGNPRRKVYWTLGKKTALTDYWDSFRDAHHQSVKITGYPTEKNLEMLKVIVGASSEPNDLVVDPFCGSGTALHAARDLGRRYLGIDASFSAARATMRRMRHGLEPMGDFVFREKDSLAELPLATPNEATTECNLVSDGRFFERYGDEITKIAAI